jgi:hypothetical protein
MPDTELFLSLAEIAGVFVGFGALIALRSSDAHPCRPSVPFSARVGPTASGDTALVWRDPLA